jgi:hypothetical protein
MAELVIQKLATRASRKIDTLCIIGERQFSTLQEGFEYLRFRFIEEKYDFSVILTVRFVHESTQMDSGMEILQNFMTSEHDMRIRMERDQKL